MVFFLELVIVLLLDFSERGLVASERGKEGIRLGVHEHILLIVFFTVLLGNLFFVVYLTVHFCLDLLLLVHIGLELWKSHVC